MSLSFSRQDLLELTPDALIALTNAGFVKRAQKDIAVGNLPQLEEQADGRIIASYDDGFITSFPPNTALAQADCTCPASNLCRHRVTLVLAYQVLAKAQAPEAASETTGEAQFWSPAEFSDESLQQAFSSLVLQAARKEALAEIPISLEPWQPAQPVPTARLPMCTVRFFSRSALIHARCDCKERTTCTHIALAIWAFRQQRAEGREADACTLQLALSERQEPLWSSKAQALKLALEEWLVALWDEGSAQIIHTLEARLAPLYLALEEQAWRWVTESLRSIEAEIRAQEKRSSRFDPLNLMRHCIYLWARLQTAKSEQKTLPLQQILGIGIKGKVPLDHLRLVSLGAQFWLEGQEQVEAGVRIALFDIASQTLLCLEREWSYPPEVSAAEATEELREKKLGQRIAGSPLQQLVASQIVTKSASRQANGLVELTGTSRQHQLFPLSPKSWEDIQPPIRQSQLHAFRTHLSQAHPEFVQPVQVLSGFYLYYPDSSLVVEEIVWEPAQQVLYALIGEQGEENEQADSDDQADFLRLVVPYQSLAPSAVDHAYQALTGQYGQLLGFTGQARLHQGILVLQPWSILCADKMLVLQSEPQCPPVSLPQGNISTPFTWQIVEEAMSLITQWLRQGVRHQRSLQSLQTLKKNLTDSGLNACAERVEKIQRFCEANQIENCVREIQCLGLLLFGIHQYFSEKS